MTTITEDEHQLDLKPSKPKRERKQPDPATDRRRGKRIVLNPGDKLRAQVADMEEQVEKLRATLDRDAAAAEKAQAKVEAQQTSIAALQETIDLLRSSALFTAP